MGELIERATKDLINSSYAISLTGAGISTESKIPDFRGPNGIWTKNPEAEEEAYRAYHQFLRDPKVAWEKVIRGEDRISTFFNVLEKAEPNPGHFALAELEKMGILKTVLTQNVDGLHQKAGSRNVIEYHGGISKLRCINCGSRIKKDEINLKELFERNQLPPRCQKCGGVLKSDGVYFNEPIPSDVTRQSLKEAWGCDLMLICGTSAVVYPFAQLPQIARERKTVIIIEVNAEPTPLTDENISDYLIQGKTGDILPKIVDEVKRWKRK